MPGTIARRAGSPSPAAEVLPESAVRRSREIGVGTTGSEDREHTKKETSDRSHTFSLKWVRILRRMLCFSTVAAFFGVGRISRWGHNHGLHGECLFG